MIRRFDFVVVDVDAGIPLDERRAYAAAQQIQLQQHIAPSWQGDETMTVRAATPDAPAKPAEVQIRLTKRTPKDPQDALGYHSTLPDGTPVIFVFTDLARQFGDAWTSVASHEVAEVVGDPRLMLSVETSKGFCAREIADAVEGDTYFIDVTIDGKTWRVAVSNFCTPEWFEPPAQLDGVRFDWMGLCKSAGEVRPNGGYAQYFDPKQGWMQVGQMRSYRAYVAWLGLSRGARRGVRRPDSRPWWRRALDVLAFWR